MMINNSAVALYIHVPFCDTICSYCDFCRVKKQDRLISQWLNALKTELESRVEVKSFDTIYIGGGTPSCLNIEQLTTLLTYLKPYSSNVKEFTVEVNPESVTLDKVKLMKQFGINRVSMGVQSVNEKLLKTLNRSHTVEMVKQVIEYFKQEEITNLSVDCMYSLPNQKIDDLKEMIDSCISWKVPHLSIYSLTIEKGSQFFRDNQQPLDEETEADMYEWIVDYLENHGYNQYEISNFSKQGYESLHNQHYWKYHDFIGVSLGAGGKENGVRYQITTNFQDYFEKRYFFEKIHLSQEEQKFEAIMMGLRMKKGIDILKFNEDFGCDFFKDYAFAIDQGENLGYLEVEGAQISCTRKGLQLCNTVIELFMNK